MTKKDKLLKILGERFADDPEAAHGVHAVLSKRYDRALEALSKELREEHKNQVATIKAEFESKLGSIIADLTAKHTAAIAKANEVAENVRKNSEESSKVSSGLSQKVSDVVNLHKNLEKKMGKQFDKYDRYGSRIEKISEFAVGAPNRSLYVAGQLPSQYYSDTNFVAGTGVTIVGGTDETNQQATITISVSGSGSGVTIETPTGIVNAVNSVFTPTKEPLFVIADGITYFENNGYTWDGTNITMAVPPSEYIRDAISS